MSPPARPPRHSSLEPGKQRSAKIAELFVYDNFSRVPVEEVEAGDICALSGIADIKIGETIASRESPVALPTIKVCARGRNHA